MSDLEDYVKEPTVAGAPYARLNEEVKKLKEENNQLAERMKEMNAKMTELETANQSLSESVEQSEEEKGLLSCQVDDLKAQLQVSARYSVPFLILTVSCFLNVYLIVHEY